MSYKDRAYWWGEHKCGYIKISSLTKFRKGTVALCRCKKTFKEKTPPDLELSIWRNMKRRCYYPNTVGYRYYGGRGIKVCDRWLESFENFLTDMGRRPDSSYSIDRINVNGNYEPSNCRWVTNKEQNRNKRNNRIVHYQNKDWVLATLEEHLKLKTGILYARLNLGWDIERAIKQPIRKKIK